MSNRLETLTGLVIVLISLGFIGYTVTKTDSGGASGGYQTSALFSDVSGVNEGADVRMSGVKIGSVSSVGIDPVSYQAEVTLSIKKDVKIPTDSALKIASDGILGGAYLAVSPGAEDTTLAAGDQFLYTQSAVNLTELLSRAVFSAGGAGNQAAQPDS